MTVPTTQRTGKTYPASNLQHLRPLEQGIPAASAPFIDTHEQMHWPPFKSGAPRLARAGTRGENPGADTRRPGASVSPVKQGYRQRLP